MGITSLRNILLIMIVALGMTVIVGDGIPIATAVHHYIPLQQEDVVVNVTTDENGTVYISITGLSIYKYVRTQLCLGIYNYTHIYVSYTGLYVDSPEEDLVPLMVEIYNGTGDSKELKYIFNATNFTEMENIQNTTVFKVAYYNVTGFTNVTYIVYNMTDPSSPQVIYEGVLRLPAMEKASIIYGKEYLSYLASLLPLALLILFAGRGKPRDVGIGLIIYGITILLLPYLGIYPAYSSLLFSISITLGAIILYFSR